MITTARLTLRPLGPDDADALHDIVSYWDVVRQLGGWPWPADRALSASRATRFDGVGDVWGITLQGALIGTIGVTIGSDGRPGIGYMLHPDHNGQGIMTEAAQAAIAYAFAQYGWAELIAETWFDNDASHALLLKLGFVQTGVTEQMAKARGEMTRSRSYLLRRADFAV